MTWSIRSLLLTTSPATISDQIFANYSWQYCSSSSKFEGFVSELKPSTLAIDFLWFRYGLIPGHRETLISLLATHFTTKLLAYLYSVDVFLKHKLNRSRQWSRGALQIFFEDVMIILFFPWLPWLWQVYQYLLCTNNHKALCFLHHVSQSGLFWFIAWPFFPDKLRIIVTKQFNSSPTASHNFRAKWSTFVRVSMCKLHRTLTWRELKRGAFLGRQLLKPIFTDCMPRRTPLIVRWDPVTLFSARSRVIPFKISNFGLLFTSWTTFPSNLGNNFGFRPQPGKVSTASVAPTILYSKLSV